MGELAVLAQFLLEHAELIGLLFSAIKAGLSPDALKEKIKAEMVLASDAQMHLELEGK